MYCLFIFIGFTVYFLFLCALRPYLYSRTFFQIMKFENQYIYPKNKKSDVDLFQIR